MESKKINIQANYKAYFRNSNKKELMNRLQILLGFLSLLIFCGCNKNIQETAKKKPKNIILLIGDGMGLAQVSSRFYFDDTEPNFARFKDIGLIETSASSHKITDSAASATAYACGEKTYNGAIGVDKDTVPIQTIIERLEPTGALTGVVATSTITHATPASFYAHTASRNSHEKIAEYLVHSSVDFFAGGGLQYFNKRSDGANLLDSLENNGFIMDTTSISLLHSLNKNKRYGYLLAGDGMPKMQEGRGDFLPAATKRALDYLSKGENGFFLMVEGSQIDWGGHANEAEYIIKEVIDFDKIIGEALDFAKKDKNTLVIVTADHETGGFALSALEVRRQANYDVIKPTFSTGGHTSSLVPVFAYGPGSQNFTGIYPNKDLFHKMVKVLEL